MTMNASTLHTAHSYRHEEVCPLCLGRYAASAERICVACEAPSCPDCAEDVEEGPEALCFACHGSTRH
jgi:hypothetical protein